MLSSVPHSSITSLLETTARPSLSLSNQGKAEQLFHDKVFPLMLKEFSEKTEELESLGKQYHLQNSKSSRSRRSSNVESEDHGDILYNKGLFLDKLTQAVEDELDHSLEGPKYTKPCYNQFSSLLETRCNEYKQEIQQKTELLKEQKQEMIGLITKRDIFADLVEEENEDFRNQAHRQASLQFEEAKADLNIVINLSIPNENEKKQFLLVMAKLVEAHINNLDSLEDQYIEVPPFSFTNPGLLCLIDGLVVVEHPHNPRQLRLSVDD